MMPCAFCGTETQATKACRRYANFVKDNPIASSRRTTLVQEQRRLLQPDPVSANFQQKQQQTDQRELFPHLPTQRFQPPVVPPVETRNVQCPLQ